MPAYIPPHLRSVQLNDTNRSPSSSQLGWVPRPATPPRPAPASGANSTDDNTPVWRRRAAVTTGFNTTANACTQSIVRQPSRLGPRHASTGRGDATQAAPLHISISSPAPLVATQTVDESYRYKTYERTCLLLQPKPIKGEQCKEEKEYAQWAGGYVEVTDKLFSQICPSNLVGKPCAFDELEGGCPMIRLCGQLEKWTIYKCPDKGFRTILDIAENVPADYAEKGFGAVNFYDGSDSESGGVELPSSTESETSSPTHDIHIQHQPVYAGKKVSFNDFSCGVRNECGHIHWEVEINCRFVGWSHYKNIPCKQVLEKSRLCSCGHDFESSRQAARDAVKSHERAAVRAGAPQPQELGKTWIY